MLESYRKWAIEQDGKDYVIWAGPTPHLVVAEPSSALQVVQGGAFVRNVGPTEALFGKGLLRLEGKPWVDRRTLFADAFRGKGLAPALPIIQEEVARLIHDWSPRREAFKPNRDLSSFMFRVLSRFLFGIELDEQRYGGQPLHRALATLATQSVLEHLFPPTLVRLRTQRQVEEARRWLDAVCEMIYEKGGNTVFLGALRGAVARQQFPRSTAIDEIRSFLIAGHETSATALSWSIAQLALHDDQTEPVVAEASRTLSQPDEVNGLVNTLRWSKETMRLYPPVPLHVAQAAKRTRLGRFEVPAGTRVDVCSYVLHRLPQLWHEPEKFAPERFSSSPAPGTWMPFLLGPHTCLGLKLAMLELPLAIAGLAGAFRFRLPKGPPKVNLRLSLHPADFWIALTPR